MSFFEVWAAGGLAVLIYMTLIWLVSVIKRDASIVDIFWGLGFVVLSVVYFILAEDGYSGRKILILALVGVWGLRLSGHILARNWGKEEDPRYQNFRRRYGKGYWWISFFQVFLLQGAIMWLISATLLAAHYFDAPDNLTPLDILGAMLWIIGIFFEAVGDWHLKRFKANPDRSIPDGFAPLGRQATNLASLQASPEDIQARLDSIRLDDDEGRFHGCWLLVYVVVRWVSPDSGARGHGRAQATRATCVCAGRRC